MRNGPLKFHRSAEALYYSRPDLKSGKILVQTIADNTSFYSDRQIAHDKRTQELMHTLGCPSVADLKHIIKMNAIKDCPVTVDDIILAEKIFGPDVASLKGKTV